MSNVLWMNEVCMHDCGCIKDMLVIRWVTLSGGKGSPVPFSSPPPPMNKRKWTLIQSHAQLTEERTLFQTEHGLREFWTFPPSLLSCTNQGLQIIFKMVPRSLKWFWLIFKMVLMFLKWVQFETVSRRIMNIRIFLRMAGHVPHFWAT